MENFLVCSLVDLKDLQSCSYSSMKLIMYAHNGAKEKSFSFCCSFYSANCIRFDPIHEITGVSKFASDHLRSNSLDSFSNFVTTNLRIFLMKLNFVIYINNEYKANKISWKIRRFVATENSWNYLMNWIYIAFNYFYNVTNITLSWEANWSALKVFVVHII